MTSVVADTIVGTITYNDVTLTNLHTSKLSGRAEYTSDGRTVAGMHWTLEVEFVVAETMESSCATTMRGLHGDLMKPGKSLDLDQLGTGLSIAKADYDISWGPKPIAFDAMPMGGNQAFLVTWSIEWFTSDCRDSGLVEVVWEMEMSGDAEGYYTRTINGGFRFTSSGRRNPDEAFLFLQVAPVPIGWRRVSQQRRMTPDHTGVSFSVVDTELRGLAYPPGIVGGEIDYDIENTGPGFAEYRCTLRGELTVSQEYAPADAAARFFLILTHHVQKSRQVVVNEVAEGCGGNRQVAPKYRPLALPQRMSWGTSLFEKRRTSRFSMSWTVSGKNVTDIFGGMGMYENLADPQAGHNYEVWAASMANIWRLGGVLKGTWDGNDVIVGLCDAQDPGVIGGLKWPERDESDKKLKKFGCGDVDELNSWLAFENKFYYREDAFETTHTPTQQFSADDRKTGNNDATGFGLFGGAFNTTDLSRSHYRWNQADVVQRHGRPGQEIAMIGKAIRLCLKPTIPELFKVNNRIVVPAGNPSVKVQPPTEIGSIFGCPIWLVRWAKVYRIESVGMISDAGNDWKPPANLVGLGY